MVTIKNVPGIVGTVADVVDLAGAVDLVDEANHLNKHKVSTDDTSVLGNIQQLMAFNGTQMVYNGMDMNYGS